MAWLAVAATAAALSATGTAFASGPQRIAFESQREGFRSQIWTLRLDGSEPERVTNDPAYASEPTWAPDARRIAFVSQRDTYECGTQLPPVSSQMCGNAEVYVTTIGEGGDRNITNSSPAYDNRPAWSPDNEWIAFTSDRDGDSDLYLVRPDGSDLRQVASTSAAEAVAAWSPDAKSLAFASDRDGNTELYLTTLDGQTTTRITDHPGFDTLPSFAPDGRSLVFASDRDGNSELYVMNRDGSGIRRLTNDPSWDSYPAWSTDGTRIAFMSDRVEQVWQIFDIKPDGSDTRQLTTDPVSAGFPAYADNADPTMAISRAGVRASRGGLIGILLTCPALEPAGCRGDLTVRTRGGRVPPGKKEFRIPGGTSARVRMRLSRGQRRLLNKARSFNASATAVARDLAGNSATFRQTFRLRAPR
jgi:Tol biopolymer transport system component